MSKHRSRLSARITARILAIVLVLSLAFPASALASVAGVAEDTTAPGKSLANTYPAYTDIDWQISLAEDAENVSVRIPLTVTAEELAAAVSDGIDFSLVRDASRGYLDPAKFPNAWAGGALDSWKTQNNQQSVNMFTVKELSPVTDNDGKVYLQVILDINCYFYTTRYKDVDYSAPHNNGGAYLDICGYFNFTASSGDKVLGSAHAKVVPLRQLPHRV